MWFETNGSDARVCKTFYDIPQLSNDRNCEGWCKIIILLERNQEMICSFVSVTSACQQYIATIVQQP